MEQYILYLALKEIVNSLNNNFKCSFNDMDSNKDNVVGIYIKGAEPSTYRTLKDGKYYNTINRVQFLIQGGLDNNSLLNCLNLSTMIKESLPATYNLYKNIAVKERDSKILNINIKDNNVVNLLIIKIDLMSDIISLGKSEQGRPRYSINFKVTYNLGGN